jgi:Tol biopolymer transport system component
MFIFAVVTVITAQAPTATGLLEEGRKAVLSGGPDAAIKIYERIVREFPNDRSNGAKALVQTIRLYDILGETGKAGEACQLLMDGYASQPEVPAEVRSRCNTPPLPRLRPGIFIARMDPATGAIRGPARGLSAEASNERYPSFSPDGKFLALRRAIDRQDLYIVRSLADARDQAMKTCLPLTTGGSGRVFWLPDSQSLLAVGSNVGLAPGCIGRSDRQTGQLLQSTALPGHQNYHSAWSALSPDGKTLYMLGNVSLGEADIQVSLAMDPLTGKFRSEAFTPPISAFSAPQPGVPNFGISPDGLTAAHIRGPSSNNALLVRYDTEGVDRHYWELFAAGTRMQGVAWSRDGSRILFAVSVDGAKWRIMQIPAEGGDVLFTGLEVSGLRYFELSSDNTQIAFDGLASTISAPGPYTPSPAPAQLEPLPAVDSPANGRGAREQ